MTNPKWIQLAGQLLEVAAKQFANHGCNDWEFPPDWSEEDKRELVSAMYTQNGDPENYDPTQPRVPDWWGMSFLGSQLKLLKGEERRAPVLRD